MTTVEPLADGPVLGALARPARPNGWGMIVLTGSSGRVDVDVARRFADRGVLAIAQQWWGGSGQARGINLTPIEVLIAGVDRLKAEGCERIAMLGTSYGALATLLTAVRDPRIEVAIAVSPAHVVWQNSGPGADGSEWPPRSSFSWRGTPLPFMALDPRAWPPFGTPQPSYLALHEASLRTFAEDVPAATVPVEDSPADVILVAGGADALWPSALAARQIAARLAARGRGATLVEHPGAGHSPVFPGEVQRPAPAERAWGGTPEADRALGAAAWTAICDRLSLTA